MLSDRVQGLEVADGQREEGQGALKGRQYACACVWERDRIDMAWQVCERGRRTLVLRPRFEIFLIATLCKQQANMIRIKNAC